MLLVLHHRCRLRRNLQSSAQWWAVSRDNARWRLTLAQVAQGAASGVGWGAGAAVGSGIINAIF